MDSNWNEWLNLVFRWIHVLFGIMWIGSSIFFNWLDSSFEPLETEEEGVIGEVWMVHGGGFYHVKKKNLKPAEIPKILHWFKWEAGFTWISGICLLSIVYYMGGGAFLVDSTVSNISVGYAIALGIGTLIAAWFIYDTLWLSRIAKNVPLAISISFLLLIAVVYGLSHVLSGRGAYMHVGAMLGTIMAGNVWIRILPSQGQMFEATKKGEKADLTLGARAKLRSMHNNYMTFPVVFIMISNHFPSTYGSNFNWIILGVLIFSSAIIKHLMNLNENFKFWGPPSIGIGIAALISLMFITATPKTSDSETNSVNSINVKSVSFTEVRTVINQRCTRCHSMKPTDDIFKTAPVGIKLDTPERIKALVPRIKFRAVVSKTMPLGNKTKMTEEERELLGRWIAQGANIN